MPQIRKKGKKNVLKSENGPELLGFSRAVGRLSRTREVGRRS
jgi:hypothetical protein